MTGGGGLIHENGSEKREPEMKFGGGGGGFGYMG